MIYFCCDQQRRQKLLDENKRRKEAGATPLNGIDYLEVVDREAPAGSPPQQTLVVTLFEPAPDLTKSHVAFTGGERVTPVRVLWLVHAHKLPAGGPLTATERLAFGRLEHPDRTLVLRTDSAGDYSTYQLAICQAPGSAAPPENFDPVLSSVDFSFKVECPSDFDCRQDCVCPPAPGKSPDIDYLARDYSGFRRLLLDRLAVLAPDWRERNPADLGITLVELLAYVGDRMTYQQDATATEAYLNTARRRVSLRRHVRLLDYAMHDGCNARTWVQFECQPAADGQVLPAGMIVLSGLPATKTLLPVGWQDLDAVRRDQPVVFQTRQRVSLFSGHNRLSFYSWGDARCCLPKGATRATLLGHWPGLLAGETLIFEEIAGARTGDPADADSQRRCAVRLTHVITLDGAMRPLADPLTGQEITEIFWSPEDALPFAFTLSVIPDAGHTGAGYLEVSVARGNCVLADQGEPIAQPERLGPVPEGVVPSPPVQDEDRCNRSPAGPLPARFQPRLQRRAQPVTMAEPAASNLLFSRAYRAATAGALDQHTLPPSVRHALQAAGVAIPHGLSVQGSEPRWTISSKSRAFLLEHNANRFDCFERTFPAAEPLVQDPRRALPADMRLTGTFEGAPTSWEVRRDLLASGPEDAHFVVEVERDGRASLRFGDNDHGRRPEAGTEFTLSYRIGNGVAGNVGADCLRHLVNLHPAASHITRVRNPLPARGGVDAEAMEEVRQRAPAAFRVQERAVTAADYAEVTERDPGIQRAAATLRWTGSWHTFFLTADRTRGRKMDATFRTALRDRLETYRLAGHDLDCEAPRLVSLEILMHVCIRPEYFRSDVRAALLLVFSSGRRADGRPGVFHPDNFTFGQPVFLSELYAAAQAVPGVASVHIEKFQRQGQPDPAPLQTGRLELGRLEIARCDNDRNFPEHGVFQLEIGGGK